MSIRFVLVSHNILENGAVLAHGVKGIECLSAGHCKPGEMQDYNQYIPFGYYVRSVERYANGARNFFVADGKLEVIVGYLIVRPE